MGRGSRLLAGGMLLATMACAHARAATDDAALDALRGLSVRIHAAMHDAAGMRGERAATFAARIDGLRHTLAAARREAAAGTPQRRKAEALALLLGNLERAAYAPAGAVPRLLPDHPAAAPRSAFGAIDARHGGSCAGALGLASPAELDGLMPARGELWLHVEAAGSSALLIDTSATPLDTDIAVFVSCAQAQANAPRATSDDAFGLAARVLLDAPAPQRAYWLRVRNQGRAGEVAIIAGATGSIGGHVTEASGGAPLANAQAYAFDADTDAFVGQAASMDDGSYAIPLAAGNYHIAADAGGHVAQAWPQVECFSAFDLASCPAGQAQAVAVEAGGATGGIDFALGTGAQVGGRVRDARSGLAVAGVQLNLADAQGQWRLYTWSDDAGRYQLSMLPAGTYFVEATAAAYKGQVFDAVDCPPPQSQCDPRNGTPVTPAMGGSVGQVDFSLQPLLYANVTVNITGNFSYYPGVNVYAADGSLILWQVVPPGQAIAVGPLPAGSYYVTAAASGWFTQLYDHVDCSGDCLDQLGSGTRVVLADSAPPPALAFDLRAQAAVSGRLTDAGSGTPLAGVMLQLWPASGAYPVNPAVSSAADGSYTVAGVAPGAYWAVASSTDHRDTAYVDAPCNDSTPYDLSGCQLTRAVHVVVGDDDVHGIDIALPPNATVSGNVSYRGAPAGTFPVAYASVWLYDASGIPLRFAQTDADGHYGIGDLPPGSYFAEAFGPDIYGQIWSGIDCPLIGQGCAATAGTPIVVGQGQDVSGIDFGVAGVHRLFGQVTEAVSGGGIGGVIVDAWDGASDAHCGDAATDAGGWYAIAADASCPSSSRKLSTDAAPGHVDEVYDGMPCPLGPAWLGLCPLDAATLVVFPDGSPELARADFVLARTDAVFRDGFD